MTLKTSKILAFAIIVLQSPGVSAADTVPRIQSANTDDLYRPGRPWEDEAEFNAVLKRAKEARERDRRGYESSLEVQRLELERLKAHPEELERVTRESRALNEAKFKENIKLRSKLVIVANLSDFVWYVNAHQALRYSIAGLYNTDLIPILGLAADYDRVKKRAPAQAQKFAQYLSSEHGIEVADIVTFLNKRLPKLDAALKRIEIRLGILDFAHPSTYNELSEQIKADETLVGEIVGVNNKGRNRLPGAHKFNTVGLVNNGDIASQVHAELADRFKDVKAFAKASFFSKTACGDFVSVPGKEAKAP